MLTDLLLALFSGPYRIWFNATITLFDGSTVALSASRDVFLRVCRPGEFYQLNQRCIACDPGTFTNTSGALICSRWCVLTAQNEQTLWLAVLLDVLLLQLACLRAQNACRAQRSSALDR